MTPKEAAFAYASHGLAVVPVYGLTPDNTCLCRRGRSCKNAGKHPWTRKGTRSASLDRRKIRRWFNNHPDANVGIVTGEASLGKIGLDIDPRNGGDLTLKTLIEKHGSLPNTLTSRTGGGGNHIFFWAVDRRLWKSPNALYPGIDLKGNWGLLVSPPSRHALGGNYSWPEGWTPDDLKQIAPLPKWLAMDIRLHRSVGKGSGRIASVITAGDIVDGHRNGSLFWFGLRMRRKGCEFEEIMSGLLTINGDRCRPPLEEFEVEGIARSVSKYLPNTPFHQAQRESRREAWRKEARGYGGRVRGVWGKNPVQEAPDPDTEQLPIARIRALTRFAIKPPPERYALARLVLEGHGVGPESLDLLAHAYERLAIHEANFTASAATRGSWPWASISTIQELLNEPIMGPLREGLRRRKRILATRNVAVSIKKALRAAGVLDVISKYEPGQRKADCFRVLIPGEASDEE